jgi:hypothetical protein
VAHSRILSYDGGMVYSCDWCMKERVDAVMYYREVFPVVFGFSGTMDVWDVWLCRSHTENIRKYGLVNIGNKLASVAGRVYDDFLIGERPVARYY